VPGVVGDLGPTVSPSTHELTGDTESSRYGTVLSHTATA
jgi:hypothetical protein